MRSRTLLSVILFSAILTVSLLVTLPAVVGALDSERQSTSAITAESINLSASEYKLRVNQTISFSVTKSGSPINASIQVEDSTAITGQDGYVEYTVTQPGPLTVTAKNDRLSEYDHIDIVVTTRNSPELDWETTLTGRQVTDTKQSDDTFRAVGDSDGTGGTALDFNISTSGNLKQRVDLRSGLAVGLPDHPDVEAVAGHETIGSNGTEIWVESPILSETYPGGTENEVVADIVAASNGSYTIAATTYSSERSDVSGFSDFWVININRTTGELVWEQTYGGDGVERAYDIIGTEDGGYLLVGHSTSVPNSSDDTYQSVVIKTASDGTKEWTRYLGGDGYETSHEAVQANDGSFLVAGTTSSYGDGQEDAWLVRLDSDGQLLVPENTHLYGGSNDDKALSIKEVRPDRYVIGGISRSFVNSDTHAWVFAMSPSTGTQLWSNIYSHNSLSWGETDYLYSMTVSEENEVFFGGRNYNESRGNTAWVGKTEPIDELTVAKDGSGDYKSIQAAVDGAHDGYTVRIQNGTYEPVRLDKNLSLVGESGTRIDCTSADSEISEGVYISDGESPKRWNISHIDITSCVDGIDAGSTQQQHGTVDDVTFANTTTGIDLEFGESNVISITNSTFRSAGSRTAIRAYRFGGTLTSRDNTILGSGLMATQGTGGHIVIDRTQFIRAGVFAHESQADWDIRDSGFLYNANSPINLNTAAGKVNISGSLFVGDPDDSNTIWASYTTGQWTISNSSIIHTRVNATGSSVGVRAENNYWWEGKSICGQMVSCSHTLSNSPQRLLFVTRGDVDELPDKATTSPVPNATVRIDAIQVPAEVLQTDSNGRITHRFEESQTNYSIVATKTDSDNTSYIGDATSFETGSDPGRTNVTVVEVTFPTRQIQLSATLNETDLQEGETANVTLRRTDTGNRINASVRYNSTVYHTGSDGWVDITFSQAGNHTLDVWKNETKSEVYEGGELTVSIAEIAPPRLHVTLRSNTTTAENTIQLGINATNDSGSVSNLTIQSPTSRIELSPNTSSYDLRFNNSTWNHSIDDYQTVTATIVATNDRGKTTTRDVQIKVYIPGDTNGDGKVDILDAAKVGQHWGAKTGTSDYSDAADLNNDGVIDIFDLVAVARHWKETAW